MAKQVPIEELQSEIQHLRDDMSETLDEIEERLRPEHLVERGKTAVKQKARDAAGTAEVFGEMAVEEVKRKPVIGIVGGLLLLLLIVRLVR